MKFLDQFAFEQERFRFAFDDVRVEIMNGIDERAEFDIPALAAATDENIG